VALFTSADDGVNVAVLLVESYETVAATAPDGPVSVKLDDVIVVESIAREKVALTAVPVETPVAFVAGEVDVTVGGVLTVVKLQVTADASAAPSDDLIVVASFAVYVVPALSAEDGVSFAVSVVESYVTVAATDEPPAGVSVKLDDVIVDGSIARENVAVGATERATPVEPSGGVSPVTVGAGGGAVVKLHVTGAASGVPSPACAPVVTVAV
jgi:hypothetical protein